METVAWISGITCAILLLIVLSKVFLHIRLRIAIKVMKDSIRDSEMVLEKLSKTIVNLEAHKILVASDPSKVKECESMITVLLQREAINRKILEDAKKQLSSLTLRAALLH